MWMKPILLEEVIIHIIWFILENKLIACHSLPQEAQRVSQEIDEGILEFKKLFDKKKKAIKVLLLDFQLTFCLTYFYGKHSCGRPSYNLISSGNLSSVKKLLSIVKDEPEISGPHSQSPTGSTSSLLPDHH
ncbi:hypothetical protein EDB19DRAFT_1827109 [Suillus lakei]|nr:hypothetical protein EDB19DRAFT_1827109 [Suillus lakei]